MKVSARVVHAAVGLVRGCHITLAGVTYSDLWEMGDFSPELLKEYDVHLDHHATRCLLLRQLAMHYGDSGSAQAYWLAMDSEHGWQLWKAFGGWSTIHTLGHLNTRTCGLCGGELNIGPERCAKCCGTGRERCVGPKGPTEALRLILEALGTEGAP